MADSPSELLRRYGLRPKHSWGQNFLGDEHALDRIVQAVNIQPGEVVVELGPGLGHLTRKLLGAGARLTAVERDRDMVRVLEDQKLPGLTVVAGNAADVDFAKVAGVPDGADVAVVGNLPYHLSSSILFEVLEQRERVSRAVFTLQQEVVTRLAAEPGNRDYGLLTVLLGLSFDVEELFSLPSHLFTPPPKVDSAVVRLSRLPKPRAQVVDHARFVRVVKAGFAHRRKTLLNSLRSDARLGDTEALCAALAQAGVEPGRRAETLSPEEFAAIERALPPPPGNRPG
ncbi:MAG TPA: 16S rRNA (adenine(1518)-N(6)/adenine(1519)-N(6))-dimethyltransferase RsmA [Longimicrobium sp.]|nr:16S rRNA (adenine(1518)-N(6)/adenine(1519)-N(6))-dimethyltransferase RsmA [Longimicrobium sp.]